MLASLCAPFASLLHMFQPGWPLAAGLAIRTIQLAPCMTKATGRQDEWCQGWLEVSLALLYCLSMIAMRQVSLIICMLEQACLSRVCEPSALDLQYHILLVCESGHFF